MGAGSVIWAIRFPVQWPRVKRPGLAVPSGTERGELVTHRHTCSLNVAILNNERCMSPCPPFAVSLVPSAGDTLSKCTLMSVQGKSTVKMSEGGDGVYSASLHRACGALLLVLRLVILAGHSSWSEAATEARGCSYHHTFTRRSWEHPEW